MELPEQKEMERGLSHFGLIHAKNFTEIAMKIQEKQNPQQLLNYFLFFNIRVGPIWKKCWNLASLFKMNPPY